jgi:hypothetical protein
LVLEKIFFKENPPFGEPIMSEMYFHEACSVFTSKYRADLSAEEIEEIIIRAYVRLLVIPGNIDGSRTTSLKRFGAVEVRLTEITISSPYMDIPPFWIEIVCHTTGKVLDSLGCFQFDEAELASAVEFISGVRRHFQPFH